MKKIFILLSFFFLFVSKVAFSQYDSLLAQKYGADEFGMKSYIMVFLKSGKVKIEDKEKLTEIQKGHMDNIKKLVSEGKLVLAGPFLDKTELRGIFILNISDMKLAEEYVNSDPAVIAGVLEMELHPWYGSAALMEIPDLHKIIQKTDL
ncbi:MAG TPA: YciI family protein [Ignavibacteria bacterium]|nr:YciI family protein [Ignavibacteria bacterium]